MSKKGHHGGSWKVAYADFVTAMMALFMCCGLPPRTSEIKEAVERAFRNPFSYVTKESVGIIPNKEMHGCQEQFGQFRFRLRRRDEHAAPDQPGLDQVLARRQRIEDDGAVKLDLTPEGFESMFLTARTNRFSSRTPTKFTTYGDWVFSTLAWEISRYTSFAIELEGHTETGNSPIREDYGDWEVSSDCANAARRKLR